MPKTIITKALAALLLLTYSQLTIADTYDPLDFERPSSWYFTFAPGVTALKGSQLIHPAIEAEGFNPEGGGPLSSLLQPGYELGYSLTAGFGFHIDHNFRLDVLYSYMNNASRRFSGTQFNLSTDENAEDYPVKGNDLNVLTHTLMANLYYDFYPYSMSIYPYIGMGAGLAFTKATAFTLQFPTYVPDPNTKVSVGESGFDTKFAYQGTIGFHKMINDSLWVDLHYRWLNVAVPKFFNHRMQVHTLALGIINYLDQGKRGRFTADYDDVLGYLRTFYLSMHLGANLITNNDIPYENVLLLPSADVFENENVMVNGALRSSNKVGYNIGGAVGFYMNDYVRIETEFAHHYARTGRLDGGLTLTDSSVNPVEQAGFYRGTGFIAYNSFMINGHYDMINVGQKYKPTVMAGVGIVRLRHSDIDGFHKSNETSTIRLANINSKTATRFAFQLGVGARRKLNKFWMLDYSYRFMVVPRPSVLTHVMQNHLLNIGFEYITTPDQDQI